MLSYATKLAYPCDPAGDKDARHQGINSCRLEFS